MDMKSNERFPLTPKNGGVAYMAMIVLYLFITFIGQTVAAATFGNDSVVYIAVCSTFSLIAMFAVIMVKLFTAKEKSIAKTIYLTTFNWKFLIFALILSVGMFLGLGFVNDAFVKVLRRVGVYVPSTYIPLNNGMQLFGFSVLLALFPAVVEEIFFRGILLDCLKGVKPVYAVFSVAVCFAFYHCSAAQFIYQLVYGVALTMLAMAAKSIIPCIVAHFANNFAVILFEYFGVNVNLYSPWLIVLGIILLAGFFAFMVLTLKKNNKNVKSESVKDFWLPYGTLGALVCAVLIVSSLFVGA